MAIDQMSQRLAHGGVGQQRVLSLDAGAFAVGLGRRIAGVGLGGLNAAALGNMDAAFPASLETLEDFVLDLHVPGVVVLAGLQHSAGRRDGIAAALHLDGIKVWPVRRVVIWVEFTPHYIARIESDELVGTGADRLEVGRL